MSSLWQPKLFLLSFAICPLFFCILLFYTPHPLLALLLALPASLLPAKAILSFLNSREERLYRQLFAHFLQLFSSELHTGNSLQTSYQQACRQLQLASSGRNLLPRQLLAVASRMDNQEAPLQLFQDLATTLPFSEGRQVFALFASQLEVGGELSSLASFSCQMMQDLNETESRIQTDANKQTVEACLLASLPFVMAICLHFMAADYFQQAFQSRLSELVLLLSFLFALLACSLCFFISAAAFQKICKSKERRLSPRWLYWRHHSLLSSFFTFLEDRLFSFCPSSLQFRLLLACEQLGDYQACSLREEGYTAFLLRQKLLKLPLWLLLGGLLSLLICQLAELSLWYALPAACLFPCLSYHQELQKAKEAKQAIMLSFPSFSGLLISLLQAGFVPSKALQLSASLLAETESPLGRELLAVKQALKNGSPAISLLDRMARTVQVPELASCFNLLALYSQNGDEKSLSLLALQNQFCWNLCRQSLQEKREKQALRILIPMMLDLVSICLLCVAPVLPQFHSVH